MRGINTDLLGGMHSFNELNFGLNWNKGIQGLLKQSLPNCPLQ